MAISFQICESFPKSPRFHSHKRQHSSSNTVVRPNLQAICDDTSLPLELQTCAETVQVVNKAKGWKWSTDHTGPWATIIATSSRREHRWIKCEKNETFMLGIVTKSGAGNTFRFAFKHGHHIQLSENLQPCEINLDDVQNDPRYFQMEESLQSKATYIRHQQSQRYVKVNSRKHLSFTNTKSEATSWIIKLSANRPTESA